jgi:hypothetical protein
MSKITSFKVDVYGPLAFDTNKEIPYTLAQLVYEELGQYQKDNQGLRWFAEMKRPKRIGNYSQYIIGVLKETIFEYQEGKRFRFDTDNGYLLDAVVDLVEGFVAGKPLPTLEAEQVDQQVPGQQGARL